MKFLAPTLPGPIFLGSTLRAPTLWAPPPETPTPLWRQRLVQGPLDLFWPAPFQAKAVLANMSGEGGARTGEEPEGPEGSASGHPKSGASKGGPEW